MAISIFVPLPENSYTTSAICTHSMTDLGRCGVTVEVLKRYCESKQIWPYVYTTCYVLPTDFLAFMHICSAIMDMGPGPRTKAQKLLCPGPGGPSF